MFDPPPGNADLESQTARLEATPIIGPDGLPVDTWPYEIIEVDGIELQARVPTAQALQAFSAAISKHSPDEVRTNMTALYIRRHLSAASHERLMELMMDPEGTDVDEKTLSRVLRAISTLGTSRPSGPSRGWRPRRRTTGAPSALA
jgi:hypothetical protein